MTKHFWSGAIGVALLTLSVGCSEMASPVAPSSITPVAVSTGGSSSADVSGATGVSTTSAISSYPTVTLQADLTASPSSVTVAAGSKVLITNNSSRYVRLFSSNCGEFSAMQLQPGVSKHTWPFNAAGKTCDYYAWDTNWSRKIFVGQVAVQ